MHVVASEDGFGVVAAVVVDVVNRRIQAVDHLDADDGPKVFLKPILLGGVFEVCALDTRQQGTGLGAAAHFYAFVGKHLTDARQKSGSHTTRHQQAFTGVAGAVLLGFGVVCDRHGHVHIAGVVHIGVAVAIEVFDDGHCGIAADSLNEAFAAAGNDDVDKLRHGNQMAHGFAVGSGHQLNGFGGQTSRHQSLLHQHGQGLVGFDGF